MAPRLNRLFAIIAACAPLAAMAAPFNFIVISHPVHAPGNETGLRVALEQADTENPTFVVVNGLKRPDEPCSDELYTERHALLQEAKSHVVVSLAASDWAQCAEGAKFAGIGRLNRLRDQLFGEDLPTGRSRLPVVRQSATVKFRSYAENARWEVGKVMFATVNLPANNNHYLNAAGRNSEFEDRLVATRDWLHRVFISAANKRQKAIVLFCDGDPFAAPPGNLRDGFAEVRRQLAGLALRYPGKVFLIHAAGGATATLRWRNGLGEIGVPVGSTAFTVDTARPQIVAIAPDVGDPGRVR